MCIYIYMYTNKYICIHYNYIHIYIIVYIYIYKSYLDNSMIVEVLRWSPFPHSSPFRYGAALLSQVVGDRSQCPKRMAAVGSLAKELEIVLTFADQDRCADVPIDLRIY